MKASVTKAYTDRETGIVHCPGESVDLSEARAAELAQGGYVEPAKAPAKKPAVRNTRKKAAPKAEKAE